MQYDFVLKMLNLDLLTPSPTWGGGRGIFGQNICYHVAPFVIPILFDMQHDIVRKKLNFDLFTPSPGSWGGGGVG